MERGGRKAFVTDKSLVHTQKEIYVYIYIREKLIYTIHKNQDSSTKLPAKQVPRLNLANLKYATSINHDADRSFKRKSFSILRTLLRIRILRIIFKKSFAP